MMKSLIAFLLLATSGCATIAHGTMQEVAVTCNVSAAQILVDGEPTPPGTVELSRSGSHTIVAIAQGYGTRMALVSAGNAELWACGDVAWAALGGFFGAVPLAVPLLIDGLDGALNELEPREVHLELVREAH